MTSAAALGLGACNFTRRQGNEPSPRVSALRGLLVVGARSMHDSLVGRLCVWVFRSSSAFIWSRRTPAGRRGAAWLLRPSRPSRKESVDFGGSIASDSLRAHYRRSPASVRASWRVCFELGGAAPPGPGGRRRGRARGARAALVAARAAAERFARYGFAGLAATVAATFTGSCQGSFLRLRL